jgi:DNA-binding transcriptional ArsR family regulator
MAYSSEALTDTFQALADPTRRAVLAKLCAGPANISELAQPFDMTLPSFMKHVQLLERSGLIKTRKSGRVRTCTLNRRQFKVVEGWLAQQRTLWEARFNRMDAWLENSEND